MITSLHSPHVEAVKALLGSRGSKARKESGQYVIEGLSSIKEALELSPEQVRTLYLTGEGMSRLATIPEGYFEIVEVSPEVMKAMTDTVTPQGLLAIAKIPENSLADFLQSSKEILKIAYFWQIQDPGNAGTVIRAADAFGFDAVIFSDNSVDIYSPKVVRSSAGSHWHIPLFTSISEEKLKSNLVGKDFEVFATDASGGLELLAAADQSKNRSAIWIFGNEARGLEGKVVSTLGAKQVAIPISGKAESLNLATAASVVMYAVSAARK
jgi:TrmH family RNA methyltransferase